LEPGPLLQIKIPWLERSLSEAMLMELSQLIKSNSFIKEYLLKKNTNQNQQKIKKTTTYKVLLSSTTRGNIT